MSRPCEGCKASHVKCDEKHPICGRCRELTLNCQYDDTLRFVDERARLERRRAGPYMRGKRPTPGQTAFRLQHVDSNAESLAADVSIARATVEGSSQDLRPTSSASNLGTHTNELTGFFEIHKAPLRDLTSKFTDPVGDDTLFLLRYFTNNIAPWLDLFNHTRYFQVFVPALAQYNPLLRQCAAAVSAKQLSRISPAEIHPTFEAVDWSYKATQFYSDALSSLRRFIPEQGTPQDPPTIPASEIDGIAQKLRNSYFSSTCLKERCMVADFIIAASSILSLYESMDSSASEWSKHLTGVHSLLEAALPLELEAQHPHDSQLPVLCHAKRACFWYFAREDVLAAHSMRSRTRLDPYRREIWENAGLVFDAQGLPDCSSLESSEASGICPGEREDLVSNNLIWILCSIASLQVPIENTIPGWSTLEEIELASRWRQLWHALDVLHGNLPMEFESYGRFVHPASSDVFTEVFFSKASSAATMQLYHFARLQLLNSPYRTATNTRNEIAHQDIVSRMERHSREIVSIAAGRPDAAARIIMVTPLSTAGMFLKADNERKAVARCLQSIEDDLGWRTEYKMKELFDFWARNQSEPNLEM